MVPKMRHGCKYAVQFPFQKGRAIHHLNNIIRLRTSKQVIIPFTLALSTKMSLLDRHPERWASIMPARLQSAYRQYIERTPLPITTRAFYAAEFAAATEGCSYIEPSVVSGSVFHAAWPRDSNDRQETCSTGLRLVHDTVCPLFVFLGDSLSRHPSSTPYIFHNEADVFESGRSPRSYLCHGQHNIPYSR
jgi:hypothetical protein